MAKSVAEYYLLNYTHCSPENSFLASWRGLAYPSHAVGTVSVPLQLFTAFCILKKSSKSMETVKWYLLNSHFWVSCVDMLVCILSTPYLFLPSMSGFTVGLFNALGVPVVVQLLIGELLNMCSLISMAMLFENRSSSIPENPFRITRIRSKCLIYGGILLFYGIIGAPFILEIPEQEYAKMYTLLMWPCPTKEFFIGPTFVLTENPDRMWAFLYFIAITFGVFFLQLFFHSFCCVYFLYIVPVTTISSQTRKIQRRFFLCILAQTVVPTMLLGAPIVFGTTAYLAGFLNQALVNVIMMTFGIHGITESITIICSHHSYRNYALGLLRIRRQMTGTAFYIKNGEGVNIKRGEHSF